MLDARFSEKSFLDWIEVFQCGATFALPSTHMSYLFSLLSENVGIGQWRAAITPSNRIASFKRVQSSTNEVIEWRVISSGWSIDNIKPQLENAFSLSDFELLSKLSPKGLMTIAKSMCVENSGNNLEMATAISKISPEQRLTHTITTSYTKVSKCLKCTTKQCEDCKKIYEQLESKTYHWSKDELVKLKARDLNTICDSLQLKKNNLRKDQKIEKILLACNSEECENVEKRVNSFLKQPRSDFAPLHTFYKDQFDVIDKANQVPYSTTMPGRWKCENTRMVHGIVKLTFTNLFTILYYDQNKVDQKTIREEIALALLTT